MNDEDFTTTVGLCTAGVVALAECFVSDRDSQRQIQTINPKREYQLAESYERHAYKLEAKRLKNKAKAKKHRYHIKMQKLINKNEKIRLEAENFRLELAARERAFNKAIEAEERIQKERLAADERIAIRQIEFLGDTRSLVERFYLPLMESLRRQYSEICTRISPDLPQGEQVQLKQKRESLDNLIVETEEEFNRCMADLNKSVITIGSRFPKSKTMRKFLVQYQLTPKSETYDDV